MDKITETDNIEELEEELDEELDEEDDDINDLIEKDSKIDINDQNCLYQSTNIQTDDEEDIIYDSEYVEEEEDNYIKEEERISDNIMTKYEYTRILSFRTKQITLGAKIMLKDVKHLTIPEIAKLELKNKMIPLKIKRPLPNNKYEIWKISELEI
jgi:DNA-directed RNA polymerase subunit K/omega